MYQYYLKLLGEMIPFLYPYSKTTSLNRLKNIGYFCGMDYASKNIYSFLEKLTRYDHSLTTALQVYKLTKDKTKTIAAFYHDVATPCFSHVIDYMNKDYLNQESTEEYTEYLIKKDKSLLECLKKDNILLDDIINFKKYSIVDNDRPKMCADRLDGIILTGISWTKNISLKDIFDILNDVYIDTNEQGEEEISFKTKEVLDRVLEINEAIDIVCHSNHDNYMMELLASITRLLIEKEIISYQDLYLYDESELFKIIFAIKDEKIKNLVDEFRNIECKDIPKIDMPLVKKREIKPLLNKIRYEKI